MKDEFLVIHSEPFRWDKVRRAQLRAERDAYYSRLNGLTRDELRNVLDPKEVHRASSVVENGEMEWLHKTSRS